MARYRVGDEVYVCSERYAGAYGVITEISKGWLRLDLGRGLGFVSVRRSAVRLAHGDPIPPEAR